MPTRPLPGLESHSLMGDLFFPQVSLRDCHNVSVFLAPSVVGLRFASPRGGPGHSLYVLDLEELGGGSCVLPCSPHSPALSHSSHCWRKSYRQNCPRGPVWCRGVSPSPPGSLWLWWVRA